jgi:hypothetical protein
MEGNDLSMAAWKRVAGVVPVELHGYAREWGEARGRLGPTATMRDGDIEWELWRSLCAALVECGAVTAADLRLPANSLDTPGCRLFAALRSWGDARAAIAKARP